MSALVRINKFLALRNAAVFAQNHSRLISTSEKKRETISAEVSAAAHTKADSAAVKKNWVSYGFEFKNETEDRNTTKSSFFFAITLCMVWGSFVWSYLPDTQLRDWAQREGYLELRRREANGLEPIARDYFDPSTVELPSDEELGQTEIII